LAIDCAGFEVEALMSIRAAKAKLRIHEVPSQERNRLYGSSNLRAISDGWRILKVILREKFGSKRQYVRAKLEAPTIHLLESATVDAGMAAESEAL
jgi:hypothetical protein